MTNKEFEKAEDLQRRIHNLSTILEFYTDPTYRHKGINLYLSSEYKVHFIDDLDFIKLVTDYLENKIKQLQNDFANL